MLFFCQNMFYKEAPEGIILHVRAQPGARKDEIAGERADSLKIRITAPPEKGRANEAIIRLLAKKLGLKKSAIRVISGEASRDKRILIQGIGRLELKTLLGT